MADRVGQHLGNYRLIRLLGKGGFAEVYLGEHLYLGKSVAIKVLHTQVTSEDVEQFRLEARRVADLEHPHIVSVRDFGVEGTTAYLVMSYASNGTLRQRHPRGTQVALPIIVSYVKQVADALQYAHDQKLIHRDIKPENMLIGQRNEVLLSDFGIATIAHRTETQNVQEAAGTALYMAPEQFKGKPRPASDQYALGVTVYEWLTGTLPFSEGDFMQLGYQHTYEPPPSLRAKNPSISAEVEQVVLTALAKDPKQRFATVQAFATALEQAFQEEQRLASAPTLRATPPVPTVPPTIQATPPPVAPTPPPSPSKEVKSPAPVVPPPKSSPVPVVSDIVSPPSPPPGRSGRKAEPPPPRKAEPVSEALPSRGDTPVRPSPPQPIAATPPSRSPAVSPPAKAPVPSAPPRASRRPRSRLSFKGWMVFLLTLLVVAGLGVWWVFSPLYPIPNRYEHDQDIAGGLVFIACFVIGLLFAAGAIAVARTSSKLKQKGVTVEGSITKRRISGKDSGASYYVTYSYESGGSTYSREAEVEQTQYFGWDIGAKVRVSYLPEDPETSMLVGEKSIFGLLTFIATLCFFLCVLFVSFLLNRH